MTSVKSVGIDDLFGEALFFTVKVVENVRDRWFLGVEVELVF